MKYIYYLIVLVTFSNNVSLAQRLLTKEEGIKVLLENNFDIKISEKDQTSATLNTSIYNTGYLPAVQAGGNAGYSLLQQEIEFQNGNTLSYDNAESKQYSASIGVNYLLFNGFGRRYLSKQLQEQLHLSEIEARTTLEKALLDYYTYYYRTANMSERLQLLEQSLEISKQRLIRAQYRYDFGQGNKLDILNARVDVDNDSLRYIQAQEDLNALKRNLLTLMGENNLNTDFEVEKEVNFTLIPGLDELLSKIPDNARIQQLQSLINIQEYAEKIQKSTLYPSLGVNTSYIWNLSDNPESAQTAGMMNHGLNAGISLNWNIFDGGKSKIHIQQAKIQRESGTLRKKQWESQLRTILTNTYNKYLNEKLIWEAARRNLETAELNFKRSEEMYKTGNINSLLFRQAQLNLLNARISVLSAQYEAKITEIQLLQLTGELQ